MVDTDALRDAFQLFPGKAVDEEILNMKDRYVCVFGPRHLTDPNGFALWVNINIEAECQTAVHCLAADFVQF